MRGSRLALAAVATLAAGAMTVPAVASEADDADLGRQVQAERDGWAAADGGVTGGAAASDDNVHRVSTWTEFREALGGGDARGDTTSRIVYVEGTINANESPSGEIQTCDDSADPEYDFDAYLTEYHPDTWGNRDPEGPLEDARDRSYRNQSRQVRQYVGSNVTIVGVGDDARIVGANIAVRDSDNVIVRNLELSDAYDCFPAWDPNDSGGNWNSEYDNLWIADSTHIWVDHNTFNDGENPPSSLPTYYGQKYEVHDGLLDITNGADLVTVSWNEFTDHDKLMLIGNSNSKISDRGKLRVTLHHNLFENTGQRTPRVRFGQVDVYNNYYNETNQGGYFSYNWGVGVESQLYAENNYFDLDESIDPSDVIREWGGTMITVKGSMVNGLTPKHRVDLAAAYNARYDPDLTDVEWTPTLRREVHATQSVKPLVTANAGSGGLDSA